MKVRKEKRETKKRGDGLTRTVIGIWEFGKRLLIK